MARELLAAGRLTRIRPFERGDVDRWEEWPAHQDPLLSGFNPPPMNRVQRDLYYTERALNPRVRLYAVVNYDGDLVGRISLREIDSRERSATLGVTFRADCLGRGYGTDALRAFLAYYFGPFGMRSLLLDVRANNARAVRCYRRCGFRETRRYWAPAEPGHARVFSDPTLTYARPYYRVAREGLQALTIDMELDASTWRRHSGATTLAAASTSGVPR